MTTVETRIHHREAPHRPAHRNARHRRGHRLRRPAGRDDARRLRRRRHQGRAPGRRFRPHPRPQQGRRRAVVEGAGPQQAHRHREAVHAGGPGAVPGPGAHRRRADRELPAGGVRTLGPVARAAARDQPGAGRPAGHRVRADRPGRAAPRVRHADRGDERAGAHDRRPGRPAHTAAVRAGRRDRGAGRRVRDHAGPAAPGAGRRPRPGDRPVAAGAAADDPRPGPDGVRPARRDPGPARQPLAQQRPAQHLPDPGRPLGRGVGQLALGRAAGAHPGRAPGGDRGAVVQLGRRAGRARRRAGRLRVAPGSARTTRRT